MVNMIIIMISEIFMFVYIYIYTFIQNSASLSTEFLSSFLGMGYRSYLCCSLKKILFYTKELSFFLSQTQKFLFHIIFDISNNIRLFYFKNSQFETIKVYNIGFKIYGQFVAKTLVPLIGVTLNNFVLEITIFDLNVFWHINLQCFRILDFQDIRALCVDNLFQM